jgi:hypothetical protein
MKKNMQALMAAVAIGAGVVVAPTAYGQAVDAGLARQQQLEQERQQKQQQKAANRTEQQANKAGRREAKREREQLGNMPKPVRETLRAQSQGAADVDYYRVEPDQTAGAGRQFGVRFTDANKHQLDVRVDREGKVISRQDLTAATAAAQAPATAAQQPAPATPAPATPTPPVATTPAPATPAPGSATASTEAPESGNPIYRRLQANEVPANIRAIFDKDTAGAKNVNYYRTKYGSQLAYEAKWTDAGGKDMRHYVSDAGATLVRGESNDNDDDARAASADRRDNDRRDDRNRDRDRRDANRDNDHRDDNATTAGSTSGAIKTGRAELNDLPKPVQTYFRRAAENGKNVKYYSTKYGSQQAYQADFTSADGKQHTVILDQSGKVLSQKTDNDKK